MDLKSLLQRVDDIESNAPSFRRSLSESVYRSPEMSKHWKKLDEGFFKGYDQYLKEVALTPDQIQNIFKQAGTQAGGAEAAQDPSKLEKIVDKVMPSSQAANLEKSLPEPDAGPVQGFDQKAQQAVANIQGADSATKQSLLQWAKNGLKKPETQQLILAALSAGLGGLISKVGPMLSMIPGGGPVVSAVTGALIAGAVSVASAKMQGKDWKSAFKGAIKPALMGGAAAVVGNLAASAVSGAVGSMGNKSDEPASTDNPQASSGQGATNTDPDAPAGGGMKNPDGTPMTNAQVAAAADRVAPVAGSATDPNKYYNSLSPDQRAATDDAIVAQAQAAGGSSTDSSGANAAPSDTGSTSNQGRLKMNQWRQDVGSPNAVYPDATAGGDDSAGAITPKGGVTLPNPDGSNPPGAFTAQDQVDLNKRVGDMMARQAASGDAAAPATDGGTPSNQGRLKMNQWRQDVGSPNAVPTTPDTPSDGSYQQAAPIGANGQPMQQVPMDTSQAPRGAAMDPNYLQGVINGEHPRPMISPEQAKAALDWQAQNGGQVQPPKGDWSSGGRASYPGGLAGWYKDHPGVRENAVDKQATLREWLKKEHLGIALAGVQIRQPVVEGIFDFFTGGKKDDAKAAGASADSLNKAWKDAGSPTDSEEIAKILQGAGVAPDAVAKIYADLKIPAPGSAAPAGQEKPADQAAPAGQEQQPAAPADAGQQAQDKQEQPAAPAQDQQAAPAQAQQPQAGAEPPATPAAEKQSKIGVGQINKIVPTLRVRDLKSVQKNVDTTLQKRSQKKQPTAEGFYSRFLGKEI